MRRHRTTSLTYTAIGGSGSALFDIDPTSGAITVARRRGARPRSGGELHARHRDRRQRHAGPVHHRDDPDQPQRPQRPTPSFTSSATMSVDEGSAGGTPVGTVAATDGDASAPNNAITYSATGGTGLTLFDVDPVTGAVTVKSGAVLNFETTSSYTLNVSGDRWRGAGRHPGPHDRASTTWPRSSPPRPTATPRSNQTYHAAPADLRRHRRRGQRPGGRDRDLLAAGHARRPLRDRPDTGVVTVGTSPIVFDPGIPANNTVSIMVRATDAGGRNTATRPTASTFSRNRHPSSRPAPP